MPSKPFRPGILYTVFQPIVDLSTQKIFGYEALTRGVGQFRLPEDMFRFSYEEGHTIALDFVCLRTAAQALRKIPSNRLLFLNVEPTTLSHTFMKGEEGEFFLRDIAPFSKRVVFELTEGMKARDFELVKRGILFIRKFGFRFAIDDVDGIDSKLIKLLSLRPDFLKIDMGLVKGLADNHLNQEMIQKICLLGKKSKSLIIVEGVERKQELEWVRKNGLHFAQGYYFARPSRILRKVLAKR